MDKYFEEIKKQKPENSRDTLAMVRHVEMILELKMNIDSNFKWCVDNLGKKTKNSVGDEIIEYFEYMRVGTYNNPYNYVPSLYINRELVRGIDQGDVAASAVCDSFTTPPETCKDFKVPVSNLLSNESILGSIMIVVVVCILIFLVSVFIFKKVMLSRVDKDMTGMVNYHLERYHQMNAQDISH